jgi:flagellar protein FliL
MADKPDIPTESPAPSGGIKALLPAIVAVLIGVGGGAALGVFVAGPVLTKGLVVPKVSKKAAHSDESADEHGDEGADEEHAADEEEGGDEEHGDEKKKDPAAAPVIHTLDNLVINPANTGGARFLLVSIAIEAGSAKALETLKARDAELRDAVLNTIASREVDALTSITYRDTVKTELAAAINARFGKRTVKRLFFPQWVIQ